MQAARTVDEVRSLAADLRLSSPIDGEVKEAVAKVMAHEDVKHPLSDQAIAEKLKEQGFQVARRTVAKYREQLGVPPAHKRK